MIAKRLGPLPSLRRHNTEFGHMRPQGIDHLGPLPHQQIARAMLHQLTLLLGRFHPYKTHAGASDRLADRLRVSGIILVTLDVSLHILRRHQTHLMGAMRDTAGSAAAPAARCRKFRRERFLLKLPSPHSITSSAP